MSDFVWKVRADMYKDRIAHAREILLPLAGKDRTVDAALSALEGAHQMARKLSKP